LQQSNRRPYCALWEIDWT